MESKNIVLIICAILSFFTVFAFNAVMIAVPSIAAEYGMNNIVQNWVTIIFLLIVAAISVPAGQVSGKYGLKKVSIISIIFFIIISIANVVVTTSEMFLVCRLLMGVSIAFLNVTSMAMVVSAFEPHERGKAIGINITGVYLGLSLSLVIAGILDFQLGWRSIVLFSIPFMVLLLAMLYKVKDEWITFEGLPLDIKGSLVYIVGILLFIYGFTRLNEPIGVILTVIGIAVLALFAYIEIRSDYPVFDVRFFKNSKFLSSNFAALCAYLATFAVTTILNYHLQYIKGYDSQMSGMILIVAPLFQVVLAPLAGRWSDKVNPQILSAVGMGLGTISLIGGISTKKTFKVVGMGLGTISLLLFSLLDADTSLIFLIVSMVFYGVGFGLFSSPNTNVIMSSVPPQATPVASASVSTVRVVGQTMSMGILTLVFAFVMGNVPMTEKYFPQLIASSQITCIICVVLCIASVFASLVGIKAKGMGD